MINANELRIGNWLQQRNIKIVGKTVYPFEVTIKELRYISRNLSCKHLERIEPIQLTPEILEKCGFVNRKLGKFCFFENGNLVVDGYENDYNGLFIGDIKYLHQLQNLYFALTGEELDIKLQ